MDAFYRWLNNSGLDKKIGAFPFYLVKLIGLTAALVIFCQSLFPRQSMSIAVVGYIVVGLLNWYQFYYKELRLDQYGRAFLTAFQMFLFHLGLYLAILFLQPISFLLAPLIAFAIAILVANEVLKDKAPEQEKKREGYRRSDAQPSNNGFSGGYYDNQNYNYSVFHTQDIRDYPEYTSHGSAHWISDRIKNELTDSVNGKPTFKGLWLGGGFFHHKEGNLVTVAPPGKGKGASLIIPNLLWKRGYSHSFVVFDPKGTNACITARFQRDSGKRVFIIDPMNLQMDNNAIHGIERAKFNPLDFIHDDIYNGCDQIANLLIPDDPNSHDKYWNQDARNLIQALLVHIMTSEDFEGNRNLVTFYKQLLRSDFEEVLVEMQVNDAVEDSGNRFMSMWENNEKQFSTVLTIAASAIKWLSNPAIQESLLSSDFDPLS